MSKIPELIKQSAKEMEEILKFVFENQNIDSDVIEQNMAQINIEQFNYANNIKATEFEREYAMAVFLLIKYKLLIEHILERIDKMKQEAQIARKRKQTTGYH